VTDIKQARAPLCASRAKPKDRRNTNDRRTTDVSIDHADRRIDSRRQTELQVLIWQNIRLRA
jgi:hypothetical protein